MFNPDLKFNFQWEVCVKIGIHLEAFHLASDSATLEGDFKKIVEKLKIQRNIKKFYRKKISAE